MTAVTGAVTVTVVTGDPTLLKPIGLRIPVLNTPARGAAIEMCHLPPGADFPNATDWIPTAPVSARDWHTGDPLDKYPDATQWLVGYNPDLGWHSGGLDVHFETNMLDVPIIVGYGRGTSRANPGRDLKFVPGVASLRRSG